jgi:DNA-binding beta-propeller fold protein YncE
VNAARLAAAAILTLAVASCGGGRPGSDQARGARITAPGRIGSAVARPSVCTTGVAAQPPLPGARPSFAAVPGHPFGVAVTADGRWAFVSLPGRPTGRVAVFWARGLAPALVSTVSVPTRAPAGLALTADDRYLLVAAGSGALVMDAARLERRAPGALLGTLSSGRGGSTASGGAFEVAGSVDGRLVFVSLESADRVAVFDLRAALAQRFRAPSLVETIGLGTAPVGLAASPDGRWLYATSESASGRLGGPPSVGTLSVIDVARAQRTPARSVLATATAGCSPVRTVVSGDGRTVWVAARASDEVLAYSAAELRRDPGRAMLAAVRVGEAPLGLALTDGDNRLLVADSDFEHTRGARSELTVIDTRAALSGRPALIGSVASGQFPRELTGSPGGTKLLVTNFGSRQLEALSRAQLP